MNPEKKALWIWTESGGARGEIFQFLRQNPMDLFVSPVKNLHNVLGVPWTDLTVFHQMKSGKCLSPLDVNGSGVLSCGWLSHV